MNTTIPALPDHLRAAADIIEANGLNHGDYYDESRALSGVAVANCPVCTLGALNLAVGLHPEAETEQTREAEAFLSERIYSNVVDDDPVERIADWSDARTQSEVVSELRRLADEAEAETASAPRVHNHVADGDTAEVRNHISGGTIHGQVIQTGNISGGLNL